MKCVICGIPLPMDSLDESSDQDWVPFFYEGDEQHGPVCTDCTCSLMETSEYGDLVVKPEFRGKLSYQDGLSEDEEDRYEVEEVLLGFILN